MFAGSRILAFATCERSVIAAVAWPWVTALAAAMEAAITKSFIIELWSRARSGTGRNSGRGEILSQGGALVDIVKAACCDAMRRGGNK